MEGEGGERGRMVEERSQLRLARLDWGRGV